MSAPFDPYLQWLGIPPSERPVDFYRLLGVQAFEADPDVIENAANLRTTQLKAAADGEHAKAAQRILTEIASAKICLLVPETKADYDKKLGALLGKSASGPHKPPVLPKKETAAEAAALSPGPSSETPALQGAPAKSDNQWKTLAVALGIGSALAVVLVGAVLLTWGGGAKPVAHQDPAPERTAPEHATQAPVQPDPQKEKGPEKQKAPEEKLKPQDPAGHDPEPKEGPPEGTLPEDPPAKPADPVDPAGTAPETPAAKDPPTEGPGPMDPAPADPSPKDPAPKDPAPEDPAPKDAPGGIFAAPERLPTPDADALAKAEAAVREVFPLERNPARPQMVELADKLLESGLDTKDDPAARFVLLRMAAEMAAKAGDFDRANRIGDRLAGLYEADLLDLKAKALEESAKSVGAAPKDQPANMLLLQNADKLVQQALDADKHLVALAVIDQVAMPAARRAGDKRLTADLTRQRADVRRMRDEFAQVEQALATLKADPDDAGANLAAGRYYGPQKGNWEKALGHLAKGSDAAMAAAAKRDLAGPADAEAQAAAGDAWWDLGDAPDHKDLEKTNLRARALHWYRMAAPKLSGLNKVKVERRIEEAGGVVGDWVLVFDGSKSHVGMPFVYDGTVPITIEAFAVPLATRGQMTVVGNFSRETDRNSQRGGLRIGIEYGSWCFEMFTRQQGDSYAYPRQARASDHLRAGRRYHVAGVFTAGEMKLFVDGRLAGSEARAGMFAPSIFPLLVGADPAQRSAAQPMTPQNFFEGAIEAVRISNVARYTQDSFTPPPKFILDRNTQLLLEFNQGKGDTVPNAAAAKHQAKIVDAQWMERSKWDELVKSRTEDGRPPRRPREPPNE